MKRVLLTGFALLAGLVCAGTASAQNVYPYMRPNYGPYYRPGLSPYLNLSRGGDPASNYFLGTIPEFQRRRDARIFRAEIGNLDARVAAEAATTPEEDRDLLRPLPTTGHPTAFNNTAGYFNNMTPGSATPRPVYTPGTRPTTPPGGGRPTTPPGGGTRPRR